MYMPQKNFLAYLLHIQKLKYNKSLDNLIECEQENRTYEILESQLFHFYCKIAFDACVIERDNYQIDLKLNYKQSWIAYTVYNKEHDYQSAVLTPSNNAFEAIVYSQSPFNVYKLILFMLLEYQIILVSKRTNYIALFCECMFELLRPL